MGTRQLSFLPKMSLDHGGELRARKRKIARPIDVKRPLHLVMRSSLARGTRSMLRPVYQGRIRKIVDDASSKYGVRVYRFVNVGNHIHLLVQPRTRKAFQGFLREISGRIAMLVTGARKTHPVGDHGTRFWDHLAYTRIVSWGRDFANLRRYFIKNHFESAGLLGRRMKAEGAQVFSLSRTTGGPPG